MSICNPTWVEWAIAFCIFAIGVIVGRLLMAIQVALMKPSSKKMNHNKKRK